MGNTLLNQTLSCYLVQRTGWIKVEGEEAGEVGEARAVGSEEAGKEQDCVSSVVRLWERMKKFFVVMHSEYFMPFLVDEARITQSNDTSIFRRNSSYRNE